MANHIKVCRKYCLAQPSRSLKFLIESRTVSSLFENCHWSVRVPLSCNLMGYLLAIKIRGHEFNLPSDGFLSKITLRELQCLKKFWCSKGLRKFIITHLNRWLKQLSIGLSCGRPGFEPKSRTNTQGLNNNRGESASFVITPANG